MSKTVTSSQARENFGELLRLASEENEEVVVTLRREPTAVLISYGEYEELERLRNLEKRLEAVEKLRAIRQRVQDRIKDDNLSIEEAYQLADFGEETIKNTLASEHRLAPSTR